MMTRTSRFPLPERTMTFAGFDWPRFVATLPKGSMDNRLKYRKQPFGAGPCYHAPTPLCAAGGHAFFYLDCDFQPGLRWAWCDDVPGDWGDSPKIRHTGWFADEDCDQTIRGIVLKLPKGRGYLAGWSMGEGMATMVDRWIHDDLMAACFDADSQAENTAEKEREYQQQLDDESEEMAA